MHDSEETATAFTVSQTRHKLLNSRKQIHESKPKRTWLEVYIEAVLIVLVALQPLSSYSWNRSDTHSRILLRLRLEFLKCQLHDCSIKSRLSTLGGMHVVNCIRVPNINHN